VSRAITPKASWRDGEFFAGSVLLELFDTAGRIFTSTAKKCWRGPMAQKTGSRRASKAINYGIIYGLAIGLAQQSECRRRKRRN